MLCVSISPDPVHQRANGNLKYFEFQLEKQTKQEAAKNLVTSQKMNGTEKREPQKTRFRDPLPERKVYEMLCRGEGIKMVRAVSPLTSTFDFACLSASFKKYI